MKDKQEKGLEKMERQNAEMTREGRVYVPTVDIYEKEDALLVRLDMPGVPQDKLDIQLENAELEISGRQAIGKPDDMDLLSGEYETGVFRRKFTVPQQIDREKIRARLHNGVLDIELPKAAQAKPRKIEITAGA